MPFEKTAKTQAWQTPGEEASETCKLEDSPFLEMRYPVTAYERGKLILLLPLLPAKCVLVFVCLMMTAAHGFVATLGANLDEPLNAWRRSVVVASRVWVRILLFVLGYWTLDFAGLENYTTAMRRGTERVVVIFNHVSFVDSMLILYIFQPCGVTKRSIANIPVLGTAIRGFQNVLVDRVEAKSKDASGETVGAKASNKAALVAARVRDPRYPNVAIAPEGTTTNGRTVVQFKRGAFVPGAPVLPVVLRYPCRHHSVAWTLRNEAWAFVRMCCQFRNYASVTILPVYTPSKEERSDASRYARNVQHLYASSLGAAPSSQDLNTSFQLMFHGVRVQNDGRTVTAPASFRAHGYPLTLGARASSVS